MTLSAKTLLRMKELRDRGHPYTVIAKLLRCDPTTVAYNLDPKLRERKLRRYQERKSL